MGHIVTLVDEVLPGIIQKSRCFKHFVHNVLHSSMVLKTKREHGLDVMSTPFAIRPLCSATLNVRKMIL